MKYQRTDSKKCIEEWIAEIFIQNREAIIGGDNN